MQTQNTFAKPDNDTAVEAKLARNFLLDRDYATEHYAVKFIVDRINSIQLDEMKIVSIVGGAASGKSTFAKKAVRILRNAGVRASILCTDNYAVGDREFRNKHLRFVDASHRYDLELMRRHINAIRSIETNDQYVRVPIIDVATGIAADLSEDMYLDKVGKTDVLIIEGDYPQNEYDIRFFLHMPDGQRLRSNIERELKDGRGELIDFESLTSSFNDRQRIIHEAHTIPALDTASYAVVAIDDENTRTYDTYERLT